MSGLLTLTIQLVCGAAGGYTAGMLFKRISLGTAGNIISGILGGGLGGLLLSMADAAVGGSGMTGAGIAGGLLSGGIGGAVVMAIIGLNAFTAIIAFGLSDVAVALSLVYLLNKEFSFRRPLRRAQRNYREIFAFSFPFWLSGLLTKFRKNIQTLLLGTLNTVTSVGIFAIVSRLNLVGHVVYSSVIASVKPHLAELYDKENRVQIGRLYQTTTRWTFMANLPLFLMMVLYPAAILSIFGRSFVGGATALAILAPLSTTESVFDDSSPTPLPINH